MKKKIRGIIIAVLAVGILVAALVILTKLPSKGSTGSSSAAVSSSTTVAINSKTMADIKSVSIKNQTDEYTVAMGADNTFSIAELSGAPVVSGAYSSVTAAAASVSAKEVIEENPTDLAQYGLNSPRAQVTITYSDNSKLELIIGNEAPLSAGVYVQVKGDAKVYLFTANRVSGFLAAKTSFVDTAITDAADTSDTAPKLSSLTLEGTSRTAPITLVPTTTTGTGYSSYDISAPKKKNGDSQATTDVVSSIYGLSATSVVAVNPTAEQLAQYGLADPYSKVTAVFDKMTISLISSEPKNSSVYVMNTAKKVIYQMSVPTTDNWITAQYKDVVSSLVFTPMISKVKTLTVTTASKTYVFDLTTVTGSDNKDDTTVNYQGQQLDISIFKKYYQNVICAMSKDYTTEKPTGTPVITYKYEYADASQSPDVVQFYTAANGKVLISVNGDCDSYEYQTYVDKILQDSEKVITNQTIQTIL